MSKIIKIKNNNSEKLEEIASLINNNKVIVFPTETVYGIGTNGLDRNAIEKLYKIKERAFSKPITLLVSSYEMICSVANIISPLEKKIISNFFPGPITLILNKKKIVPNILTANTDTVGVRMPDNELILKLIEYCKVPIATSSANISGFPASIDVEDIYNCFKDKVDLYIDGGKSRIGVPSTVVKVENNDIKILREGIITKKDILARIKDN